MRSIGSMIIASTLLFSSCATLFTGTSDNIRFTSNPVGAKIMIDGLVVGKTPATVTIKRSFNDRQVTLKLDGYEDRIFVLQKEFNVVAILNMFGLLGWAIDAVTGSIYRYNPKNYELDLEAVVSYDIKELERDSWGRYLVPSVGSIRLYDNDLGIVIAFMQ